MLQLLNASDFDSFSFKLGTITDLLLLFFLNLVNVRHVANDSIYLIACVQLTRTGGVGPSNSQHPAYLISDEDISFSADF